MNRAFAAARRKGLEAGLRGQTVQQNPYGDVRGNAGHVTFARAFRRYWLEGFAEGADKLKREGRRGPKPLPCPFCGELPEIEPWDGGLPTKRMVRCRSVTCDATPAVSGETRAKAIQRWNVRT